MKDVPIWEKSNLTLEEAAAYSGIGINKLRTLSDGEHCQFVLWIGSKRLIKRRRLDEYLDKAYSIYSSLRFYRKSRKQCNSQPAYLRYAIQRCCCCIKKLNCYNAQATSANCISQICCFDRNYF